MTLNLIPPNTEAQDSKGPYSIAGRVYDSNGNKLPEGIEGTYAAIIIEHEGEKKTFIDYSGIDKDNEGDYWYSVTIPDGKWEFGDSYWVRVNGTAWGDLNFTCKGHDNPDKFKWSIQEVGNEITDVNTVDSKFDWEGKDEFPVILLVIIVIIIAVLLVILYIFRHYGYY
jgi:hypothetical protein